VSLYDSLGPGPHLDLGIERLVELQIKSYSRQLFGAEQMDIYGK
jgi:hypothetical protein